MSVQVDVAVGPWVDQDSCLDDGLLAQLAVELGGNPTPPASLPASFAPVAGQVPAEQHLQYSAAGTQQQGRLPLSHAGSLPAGGADSAPNALLPQNSINQSTALPFGFGCNLQQLRTSGSLPAGFVNALSNPQQQQQQQGLPGALNSASSLPFAPSSLLQSHMQPLLMFASSLGGLMAGGAADVRPAASKSQSPTTSSGCQQGVEQDSLDHADAARASKTLNKGALAQKRFRERQKERMRANEAQVAELTRKLGQLEMEKARLQSRTRLLEQVVSLNLIHEAKIQTNREIMVREQEILLEDLAAFMLQLSAAATANNTAGSSTTSSSTTSSPEWMAAALNPNPLQQQQGLQQQGFGGQPAGQLGQQDVLHLLQQQQQAAGGVGGSSGSGVGWSSGRVSSLTQVIRGWTVQTMVDGVFPQYISCLQQLLPIINGGSPRSGSNAAAAAAQQQVEQLVLKRREMTDRHALFSHYYWAVWCFNRGDSGAQQVAPPSQEDWARVLQQLNLSKQQTEAIVAARSTLLAELHRVAADWQCVLPTLALQLLQVPRAQWHTVAAVQAMVNNLAAERQAVVGFLHTLIDEVLTPVQEGQLEASSYPWCPDVWAIAGAAAAAAAVTGSNGQQDGSSRSKTGSKAGVHAAAAAAAAAAAGVQDWQQQQQQQQHQVVQSVPGGVDEDPMAALAMGTDVLQPLMPFMTAFQLLREPVTAKGAGLRLKRALLLDPFRTVVPAAAYPQPSASDVAAMSLLDAHCGSFQQVMLWDWLKANLPSYVTMLGMQPNTTTAAATEAAAAAAATTAAPCNVLLPGMQGGMGMALLNPALPGGYQLANGGGLMMM